MLRFHLVRNEDVSGMSGTGIVAEGVRFTNGKCVMFWKTATSSMGVYDSVTHVIEIHGHEGRTRIEWLD